MVYTYQKVCYCDDETRSQALQRKKWTWIGEIVYYVILKNRQDWKQEHVGDV